MTKIRRFGPVGFGFVLVFLLGMLTLTPSAISQNSYGAVVGTVTDSSGAAIPGATITLTNIGTNEKKVMESDAAGNYRFVSLPPTQYRVEIQKTNFKRIIKSPITVLTDSTARVDGLLAIGSVTETVEVNTQAPLLQTESGTLGSQVEGKTVEAMPLNGRNTMALIALVPGVVPQGSTAGPAAMNQGDHTNNGGWGNYQIGGSIAGHGVIFIDGAPNNALGSNVVGFIPTQDAIQEFKVSTSAVSPEFGRFAGGVVEMTSKSGGNSFHGAAYEYLRNTVLDANTWGYNQIPNQPTHQKLNQNQFGVVVTGPVKKDKIFFMFSWEGFRNLQGLTQATNIPDKGMMADSSPSVPGHFTYPSLSKDPWAGKNCLSYTGSGATERTVVNSACLDSAAQKFKMYFPSTSSPYYKSGVAVGDTNFNTPYVVGDNADQYNARGDINLTARQRLFLRYSYMKMKDKAADIYGSANGLNTSNAGSRYATQQGVIGDTYTINPMTIADFRLSYMRAYGDDVQGSNGTPEAANFIKSLGSGWATVASNATTVQLPKISIGAGGPGGGPGLYNLFGFMPMFLFDKHLHDTYALSASLIKIRGNHTVKLGGEVRFMDQPDIAAFMPDGQVATSSSRYTGNEWLNFLLGLPDNIQMQTGARTGAFNWYQGYYASDTWTVNRELTISAGLRWELPGGIAERKDKNTVILPDLVSSGTKGSLALVNSAESKDRTTEPALYHLFSPRLGVAYRLNSNTVLRGGYALTYLAPDMGGVTPNNSPVNSAPSQAQNDPHSVFYTVANPFAGITINQPLGRAWGKDFVKQYQSVYAGQDASGPAPTAKLTYMQQWNLVVGEQFKYSQSVEVSYAGALAVHLLPAGGSWNLDQPNQAQFSSIAACENGSTDSKCADERTNFTPFPNYHNVINTNNYNGTMNYSSMQVRYEKRLASGGLITSGYTLSKSLGDSDTASPWLDSGAVGQPQDYTNIKGEHSILSYSMKNRWVTSYVADLPLGKGKKFLNSLNGFGDRLVGGWAVNGITTLMSGSPIMLTGGGNQTGNWNAGTLRPNVVAGCNKTVAGNSQSRLGKWFNTSCFQALDPSSFTFGNEPRADSTLRTSGVANWDFSLQKQTKITEGNNLEFRMEFYNIFNRRQWAMPGNDAARGDFGVVQDQQNAPRQIQASLRFNF